MYIFLLLIMIIYKYNINDLDINLVSLTHIHMIYLIRILIYNNIRKRKYFQIVKPLI